MQRFVAGAVAGLLLVTGGILIWQGHAERQAQLPPPPPALPARPLQLAQIDPAAAPLRLAKIATVVESDQSKEQKRFARYDKDRNGAVSLPEMVDSRRKAFAKLDLDHDGKLSFEEYVHKTAIKFDHADGNHDHQLSAPEFATTAAKHRKKKPTCACPQSAADISETADSSQN